ncbi:MAG: AraC family transcriptional regulator [Ferruginibacter sp.]
MSERLLDTIPLVDNVIANYLFKSDYYHIKNWSFDFNGDRQTSDGYNDCFCIVIVKKGNFLFDMARKSHDMHTGHIVIEKPGFEYRLRPASGECTIFNFTKDFYDELIKNSGLERSFFFSNPDMLSVILNTTPGTDYLHHRILKILQSAGKMEMDNLVLDLVNIIVASITNTSRDDIEHSLRINHLVTVEKAKEYMNENFSRDISIQEISCYSCVSPFHFSRIFKKFTSFSPYQYLLNTRLKHSELLLKNSAMPVADVSFSSGFNSAGHFSTAFKQKYKVNPTQYRRV